MHVAIVSPYSMSEPGGVQDHTRELARALKRRGLDVTLFGPEMRGEQNKLEGIATISLGPAVRIPANGSIAPVGIDPRMIVRFDLTLDPVDLIHLHEPFLPPAWAALARRPKGTRVVGTFHAAAERFLPYAIASPFVRRIARRLDATTAASPEARRLVRRYVSLDPVIVPNGVDAAAFAQAAPDPWASGLGRVVLFVGRPEPRKGFGVVLRAFERASATRPDVHLVCIPAESDSLPSGLDASRVHCLGHVSRQRLMALHKAAGVVCCASVGSESFGIVVLEGLAGGSAVLASDIPGYHHAGGGAPMYVAPGDAEAWTKALESLLDDDGLRAEVAGRGPAHALLFDWSRVAEQTTAVYERALAG